MGKLDGKVALITGSATGIGRATALLFAREGAKVVVADYAPDEGKETVRMIRDAGSEAIFVEADVRRADDVKKMIRMAVDTCGRIDVLYNNAGIMGRWIFTGDLDEQEFDDIVATNLRGVFLGCKYVLPVMLDQGGGVIINTASTAGLIGLPGLPGYCASKAGVIQLTKTAALEYADKNIRVNCICPGGIKTRMSEPEPTGTEPAFRQSQPMRRFGLPEEVSQAALYLACDDSSFVSGAALVVDGGWTSGIPKARPKKQ